MNLHFKKPRSTSSHVALAFAAALAGSPAVAPAAATLSAPAMQGATTAVVPSAAALAQIGQITQSAFWLKGPRWIELWPEVTHVEAVRK
jgi:hypothetical protein